MLRRGVSLPVCGHKRRGVHAVASKGFDESNVERYNKARPAYAKDALANVAKLAFSQRQRHQPNAPVHLIELGSGTGKFTTSFLNFIDAASAEASQTKALEVPQGSTYFATEPSSAFLKSLEENVSSSSRSSRDNKSLLKISVAQGSASNIAATDASADAVLAAQCFHWMANTESLLEIARVLKPGGRLINVWNVLNQRIGWIRELEMSIINPFYKEREEASGMEVIPRYISMDWEQVFNSSVVQQNFSLPLLKWEGGKQIFIVSAKDIVDRVISVSVVNMASEEKKKQVEQDIHLLLATHPNTRHISNDRYELEYITNIASCCRIYERG